MPATKGAGPRGWRTDFRPPEDAKTEGPSTTATPDGASDQNTPGDVGPPHILRGLHTEPPFHGARNPPIWCHTRSGVHQHYPQQCGGAGDCVPLDLTATLHSTGTALSDKANDDDTLPSSALYSVPLGRVTLDNDTRAIRDASRSTPPQPHPTVMLDQFILLSNISPHLPLSAPQDPPSPCHD